MFPEQLTQLVEGCPFTGSMHLEDAWHKLHAVTGLQDMPSESFAHSVHDFEKSAKRCASIDEYGVFCFNEVVRMQRQFIVFDKLALAVVRIRVYGAIPVVYGGIEASPFGPVLVCQFQKHWQIDLCR